MRPERTLRKSAGGERMSLHVAGAKYKYALSWVHQRFGSALVGNDIFAGIGM
jgi:hypothetical protein